MTPRKFWTMCRLHDWTYMYSDDREAYRNGKEENEALINAALSNPELMAIYHAWEGYHFRCEAKPPEPKMD